jgi:ribosome-binding factor A
MRRKSGSASARAVRVAEQLHQELAEIIRAEVKDPRLGMVTITSLDLTPDYAYATAWFSVLPDDAETVAATLEGLRAAAGFIRSQLGRRVRIHTTPEVRFAHDRSTERGMAMSRLIDEANARRSADDDHDGDHDGDHAQAPAPRPSNGPA